MCNQFNLRFGIDVIDADLVSREVVEPGKPALKLIHQEFGDKVLSNTGELDRKALRAIVFDDLGKRERLEEIIHPQIRTRISELIGNISSGYGLLGIPLLAESNQRSNIDRVLVIDCPEHIQIARVIERDGTSEAEAMAIMRSQASREQRLAIADDVLVNDGRNENLDEEIGALHEVYHSLSARYGRVCGSSE